jgi:PAS domain S-box-containing protein
MDDEKLYKTLIEGTNDLIHSVKSDQSFEFINKAWSRTLGYSLEEVSELKLHNIIFPEVLEENKSMLASVLEGIAMTKFETIFIAKDGSRVYVEGNVFPRYEDDKVVAAQGFWRDVTDKKEAEMKLIEERKRADFLLDLMIHDVTNINQEIISTLELLTNDPSLPPHLKDIVEEGVKEVERASNLVANVRKISIVQTSDHKMALHDLGEALYVASQAVDPTFPEKKLKITTNLDKGKFFIMADEYLDDVFKSLLHNAMKFDEKSEVKIDVIAEPIKHTPFLKIEIKDRGPGIADTHKEDVFARVTDRREGILGLGLGLTLVKKILENYGAQIRVEDRVEGDHTKGANFVILIRYEQTQSGSDN